MADVRDGDGAEGDGWGGPERLTVEWALAMTLMRSMRVKPDAGKWFFMGASLSALQRFRPALKQPDETVRRSL